MSSTSIRDLQTAGAHFQAGRYEQAERLCQTLVADSATRIDAMHMLALIYRRRNLFGDAAQQFQICLEAAPERADIHANYGNLLKAQGLLSDAIAQYRLALKNDAAFRPARIALARALNASGEHADALDEAERLLRKSSDDAEALAARAAANRGLLREQRSESDYRRALEIKPNYGAAHHDYGALLASMSRHEEALGELMLAAQAGVTGPEITYNIASALAGLNRFDESEALLLQAVEALPQAIELHRLLARLLYMRGDPEFDAPIKAATKRVTEKQSLCIAHAQLLIAANDLDAASAVLEAVDERNTPAVQRELAAIHQQAGRYEEALHAAEAALSADSGHVTDTNLVIDALLSLGRADEAMPHIEAQRQRAPLNQWYVAMEATAARLLGDPRYEQLYDYERFVQAFELSTPRGWSSIEEFRRDLNSALVERHRFRAQPLDQSLRHGTQTPRGLLGDPDPVIVAFLDALREPIEAYRRQIGDDASHPMTARNHGKLKMTGCWSVRLRSGGFHVNHVHPEGWISSAYYAEVPPEVSDADRKSGWIKFGEPRFPVPGATAEKFVQPREGTLVLFPSYMWHGTTPILDDAARMTAAFDAVCTDD